MGSTPLRTIAAFLLLIQCAEAFLPSSFAPSSPFVVVVAPPPRYSSSAACSTATRGEGRGKAFGVSRRCGLDDGDDDARPIRAGRRSALATSPYASRRRVRMTANDDDDRTNEGRSDLGGSGDDDPAEEEENPAAVTDFYIRKSLYKDLKSVADIVVQSFYNSTDSPLRHLYYVSELNRLQQNFPYSDPLHSMYVAIDRNDDDTIVGFVDVDGRPSKLRLAPPRPYLSDLAVRSDKRRSGIATTLVQTCEAWAADAGFEELYIRVERTNEAAVRMYEDLGYEARSHEIFGVEDRTTLLRRDLNMVDSSLSCAEGGDAGREDGMDGQDSVPILDYSL